jgi:hypothetical protein
MRKKIKEKLNPHKLTEEQFKEFLRQSGIRRKEHNAAMVAYRRAREKDPTLPDKRFKGKEI